MARPWNGVGAFMLTVAIVVVGFVTTTTAVLVHGRPIGEAAEVITERALPSLGQLQQAQNHTELIRVRVEHYLARIEPTPEDREGVSQAVGALRQDIARYVGLPEFPGERELWTELFMSVDDVARQVGRALAARDGGDPEAAKRIFHAALVPAIERAQAALVRGERLNVAAVDSFIDRMELVRVSSGRLALALNALCVGLAALLMVWTVRAARRQRQLEESYARTLRDRAEEMEIFAGRVAHDILSPLGSTSMALEVLAKTEDERSRRLATRGLNGIARVRSTVDGLLEFARAGARPSEGAVVDVETVTKQVVDSLEAQASAAGVALDVRSEGGPHAVNASGGVLTSILMNLVQNAVKYMGDAAERRVLVTIRRRAEFVRVEVSDTAAGIPPDLEKRVFEPYFRANQGAGSGLGLGLATVKRLVAGHAGRVGVERSPAGGSLFWFEMPALGPRPEPISTTASSLLHGT
jgi:signal transduction histidine kinase